MNKEKLADAASLYAGDCSVDRDSYTMIEYAFKQGAHWLLSQSLSERLTDAEKYKIRDHYGAAHVIALNTPRIPIDEFRDMMHKIFGTELFTNQPND